MMPQEGSIYSLVMGAVSAGIGVWISYIIYESIKPSLLLSPIDFGRNLSAYLTAAGSVVPAAKMVIHKDLDHFAIWLFSVLVVGVSSFIVGWLYALIFKSNKSKDIFQEAVIKVDESSEKIKRRFFNADNDISNEAYERALVEIETGDIDKGMWAKAMAHSDGDSEKSKSLYIKYRAESMQLYLDDEVATKKVATKKVATKKVATKKAAAKKAATKKVAAKKVATKKVAAKKVAAKEDSITGKKDSPVVTTIFAMAIGGIVFLAYKNVAKDYALNNKEGQSVYSNSQNDKAAQKLADEIIMRALNMRDPNLQVEEISNKVVGNGVYKPLFGEIPSVDTDFYNALHPSEEESYLTEDGFYINRKHWFMVESEKKATPGASFRNGNAVSVLSFYNKTKDAQLVFSVEVFKIDNDYTGEWIDVEKIIDAVGDSYLFDDLAFSRRLNKLSLAEFSKFSSIPANWPVNHRDGYKIRATQGFLATGKKNTVYFVYTEINSKKDKISKKDKKKAAMFLRSFSILK